MKITKKKIVGITFISFLFGVVLGGFPLEYLFEKAKPIVKSALKGQSYIDPSRKKELDALYEKVSKGGVIIIDDYGHWGGSKKAVDEFFKDKYVWMHYVDYACRLIIKEWS